MLWAPSSPAVRSWTAVGIRYDQPGTATPRPARRGRGFRPDRPVKRRYEAPRRPLRPSAVRGGGDGPSTAAWWPPGRCCASWSPRGSGGSSRRAWRTSSSSAQALVEFALILPLLLSLLLGSAAVGVTILTSMELHHAAIEAATAGASTSDPDRCSVALSTASTVLGHSPTGSSCSLSATMVEIHLDDAVPWTIPPLPSNVSTTERSAIR